MRTRKKYWILSIVLLWVTCSLLFYYFYHIEKKNKIEEIIGYQKVHALLAKRNFEQFFNKWYNILHYLSGDSNIIQINAKGKEDLAKFLKLFSGEIKGITRTDASGILIYTVPEFPAVIGTDLSQQKHIKQLISTHKPVIGSVFETLEGYQALVIHWPILKNDQYQGSVGFMLNIEKLAKELLQEIRIGDSGSPWMINSDSIELYCIKHEHVGKKLDKSHLNRSHIVDLMLHGKTGTSAYPSSKGSNQTKYAYYLPIKIHNTFWSLAITYSEEEITASLVNFRNRLLFIFTLIFLTGIILLYYGIKAWLIVRESNLRRIVEKKLRESEEKYRIVIETTDTGYALTDKNGIIRDANNKFSQMAGHPELENVIGKSIESWTSHTDYTRFNSFLKKCLTEGGVHNIELEFKHPEGMVIPVEINASKAFVKKQELIMMLCRNISERKQVREELLKERKLLRTLIDNLPSGVFIKDAVYRKTIANAVHIKGVLGHLKRTGLNADIDIIGKTDFEVFSLEEASAFLQDDSKVIENGQPILNKVEQGWGPNKERIWLLVSKVPIKANDGSIMGMVGITTDITDQKKIEEQLISSKEKAEQSDRLKTAFLNNISHEIRTPLNAIMGFTSFLKENNLTDDKKNQYVNIILQSSNQLLLIITDIINIATIEAGQLTVNLSTINLNTELHTIYEHYRNAAIFKNIDFSYSTGLSNEKSFIQTDAIKFLEILSNLINNAIKFTDRGGVSFGYILEDNALVFYVEDSGIGIREEYHKAIFDRFWQVESSPSNKYGGTGLGLSIAKTYIELLGGNIWLTSHPGSGTTFYFTLPFKL